MAKFISVDEQLKKAKNFLAKGNIIEAKNCFQNILNKYPKNIRALEGIEKIRQSSSPGETNFNQCVKKLIEYYNTGQYSELILFGKKVSVQFPEKVIIQNIIGAGYTALNQFSDAIYHYKAALKLEPKNAEVLNNLGLTYKEIGDFEKANECFENSISIKPNFAEAFNNLALSLKEERKFEKAIISLEKAISLKNNYAEAHYNLGNVYNLKGELEKSINMFTKALNIKPDYFDAFNNLGAVYNLKKDYDKAYQYIKKAIALNPNNVDAYNNLGTSALNLNKEEEAITHFNKAISIDPESITAYSNLCGLFEKSNKIEEFENILEKAKELKLDQFDEIKFHEAQLFSRKKDFDRSISLLKSIDDNKISEKTKKDKYGLLGKDFDKVQNYKEAFKCFQKTNELVKVGVEYKQFNPTIYQEEILELINSYSKAKKISWMNYHQKLNFQPVFLVGFPRSGTTLLDTILSSHSNIITLEEKPMVAMVKMHLNKIATIENLLNLSEREVIKLRDVYHQELIKHTNIEKIKNKILIDKLPLSIIDIGLILRLFPDAKFILSLRHPLDCILSCFMQTFNLNNAMANFLDLKNTAQLYSNSMKLFDIYSKVFKIKYHIVKYENLIHSLKSEAVSLLKFLDLSWQDNMTKYRELALKKKINTPSYNQVTEKIYTRASGRWKNYEKELEFIFPEIKFWIDRWKYNF